MWSRGGAGNLSERSARMWQNFPGFKSGVDGHNAENLFIEPFYDPGTPWMAKAGYTRLSVGNGIIRTDNLVPRRAVTFEGRCSAIVDHAAPHSPDRAESIILFLHPGQRLNDKVLIKWR